MSGPKRGRYHIAYDPTPQRLSALRGFCGRLDSWIQRNEGLLLRFLGEDGLAQAEEARNEVEDEILAGEPDRGFDAYGRAWDTFRQLHSEAVAARDLARLLRERRRSQEEHDRRQRQVRAQAQAAEAVEQCHTLWEDTDHQSLLSRWTSADRLRALLSSLESLSNDTSERTLARAATWREQFQAVLGTAKQASQRNAQRFTELLPLLKADLEAAASLNLTVLPETERGELQEERTRLTERIAEAIGDDDAAAAEQVHRCSERFVVHCRVLVQEAEMHFAATRWAEALGKLGYAVTERQDGGVHLLEAKGFPTRIVSVCLTPGSNEVRLNIAPERDTGRCTSDVASLQKLLAASGVKLEMTDMGRATPHGATRLINQTQQQVRLRQ